MSSDLLRPRQRSELIAAGFTARELDGLLRTGSLAAVRRGAYVDAADERLALATARHALLVHATAPRLHAESVFSHVSAAVLHGLPTWDIPLDRVHVTRNRRSGARRSGVVVLHAAGVAPGELVAVDGVAVTDVPRAVVDLARSVGFERAVAVADAALRRGGVDEGALLEALTRAAGRPGLAQARRVIAAADGRAESVGESRSRLALSRAGVPLPVLQQEMRAADGATLGRVDFWWREQRTVGEFDGLEKYGRLLRPGQSPRDAVVAEKRREDALRDTGLQVVRWVWAELDRFDDIVVPRLRRAFERSCR
ncbi:type IV toxin-antitoxin system AbiEi family antitoxin domain-containing protein [Pseudonocardia sp.]|uniref:type IV toxin-antitoxin system AbiEi family antitoxin domain-containing protein n=1 Tax=Pseudonocardia sp. TaxID=60912 RepID=UPI003D100D60